MYTSHNITEQDELIVRYVEENGSSGQRIFNLKGRGIAKVELAAFSPSMCIMRALDSKGGVVDIFSINANQSSQF